MFSRVKALLSQLRHVTEGPTAPPKPRPFPQASIQYLIGEALARQSANLGITGGGSKVHILRPNSQTASYCGQFLKLVDVVHSVDDFPLTEICQHCYHLYKEDPDVVI